MVSVDISDSTMEITTILHQLGFSQKETAVYLATLGKYSVVHQIVIDRLGADW